MVELCSYFGPLVDVRLPDSRLPAPKKQLGGVRSDELRIEWSVKSNMQTVRFGLKLASDIFSGLARIMWGQAGTVSAYRRFYFTNTLLLKGNIANASTTPSCQPSHTILND